MSSSSVFRDLLSGDVVAGCTAQPDCKEKLGAADSDESLMQRLQAGDNQVLEILFHRYKLLVQGIGLRVLRDFCEAQELVQDVFLHVFRTCEQFDAARGPLRSWLLQVTYWRALDKRNYLATRRFYNDDNSDVESAESSGYRDDFAKSAELKEIVEFAFAGLTERQRLTLTLFFVDGYSLREIACYLDESLANARNHYYRGLKKVRATFEMESCRASGNLDAGRLRT